MVELDPENEIGEAENPISSYRPATIGTEVSIPGE
jgi:hypothetical protein